MPAPVKPGDRLTWTHYFAPGEGWREPVTRAGTVFSGAPTGNGLSNAWWVEPDERLDGEVLPWGVLCVGRASRRSCLREDEPVKGELYSSGRWQHQAGALTQGAEAWRLRLAAEQDVAARGALAADQDVAVLRELAARGPLSDTALGGWDQVRRLSDEGLVAREWRIAGWKITDAGRAELAA
jgi:hypothetical protein